MSNNENLESSTSQDNTLSRAVVEYEIIEGNLVNMSKDPNQLKTGYSTFTCFEKNRNFYLNLLNVIFNSGCCDQVKKLAASTLKIFLNKNWSDENYITNEERRVRIRNIINTSPSYLGHCECTSK